MTITHITTRESHDNDGIGYSVTVFYEKFAKVSYEFIADDLTDIFQQATEILPEAVKDYLTDNRTDRYTEGDTIITEFSAQEKETTT